MEEIGSHSESLKQRRMAHRELVGGMEGCKEPLVRAISSAHTSYEVHNPLACMLFAVNDQVGSLSMNAVSSIFIPEFTAFIWEVFDCCLNFL